MNRLRLGIIFAVIVVSGCQRDISGTYLCTDKTTVAWLQLVRTPDNHLSGQLAISILKSDGSIERSVASINGAVDGTNVTLSTSKLFGLDTFTFTGISRGSTLTLSSGTDPTLFVFKRASLKAFQTHENDLITNQKAILDAKTEADARRRRDEAAAAFVTGTNQLVASMLRFDSEANAHLGRFSNVEKNYQAITTKIAAYVNRERQLTAYSNSSLARSQLELNATQTSFATDQIHNQVTELQSSLEFNVTPMVNKVETMQQACSTTTPLLTPRQSTERTNACNKLLETVPQFRQQYDAMTSGLGHLEQVYQKEHASQQELLQSAQKLER